MDKVLTPGVMDQDTLDNGLIIKSVELGLILGLMVVNMKVSG